MYLNSKVNTFNTRRVQFFRVIIWNDWLHYAGTFLVSIILLYYNVCSNVLHVSLEYLTLIDIIDALKF